ncbi:LysR family transcriptional regulator [Lutispora sp.]|uniref:LysR family transcriptional regulator n=1 Tax=Lutispora sp. TaxID=2828727 RepID=UPI002B208709|nr:LysR family transcriptional regulator [Lutispora sp.]MEA4961016.1 LysR family transcriptional regulator [Lutispora sp.]
MLTLRHLKIFLWVCNTGNMTAAAEKLYMTQPSVSQAIAEIERHYEVKLFERLGKKLYITLAGKRLLSYANHIINLNEEIEREMRELRNNGSIRIGASVTVGTYVLSEIIKEFRKVNPIAKIQSIVDNTKVVEEMLLDDRVDLGLVEGIIHSEDLIANPFMNDELVLICNPEHDWAKTGYIEPSQIDGAGFIVREEGSGTRELFDSLMRANGVKWYPTWICNNSETIKNAVEAGMGISIISKMSVEREAADGKLVIVDIKGIGFKRMFNFVYHKNKYISDTMISFIDIIRTKGHRIGSETTRS